MTVSDEEFYALLDILRMSREGYRRVRGSAKKRIGKYLEKLGTDFDGYLHLVKEREDVRAETQQLLTVSITRFFRDPELWELLESSIIPALVEDREEVNCWVSGCSLGQEVYSIRYTWKRAAAAQGKKFSILATDMNPVYLGKARQGIYKTTSLKGLPDDLKDKMFEPESPGLVRVRDEFRSGIDWRVHDFREEANTPSFQLLFLRNSLFTYYGEQEQIRAGALALQKLDAGGFFIIGKKEKLPVGFRLNLARCSGFVYRKS